ncbi:MAG: hypothetical protein K8G78_09760, partial [Deltaproteobacteria bacterium]|nr:hypothetical protein [Candidatus Kapabacteria bacterium]
MLHTRDSVLGMIFRYVVIVLSVTVMQGADTDSSGNQSGTILVGQVFGGASVHSLDFTELPGFPNCCSSYTNGFGVSAGLGVGIFTTTPLKLFNRAVQVGVMGGLRLLPGTALQNEEVGNIISGTSVTDGIVEHRASLSYTTFEVEPAALLPTPLTDVFLLTGIRVGVPLTTHLEQQQELVAPADPAYVFENGTRIREAQQGQLPQPTSLTFSIRLAALYRVPLTKDINFFPFASYTVGLSSIT